MHNPGDLLWTAIWLIAAALAGAAAIFVARAWRKRYHASELQQPFTLQDLRAMRDRGDISAAEFDAMKAAVVGQVGGAAMKNPRARQSGPVGRGDLGGTPAAWLADGGDAASGRREHSRSHDDGPPGSDDANGATSTDAGNGGDGGDGGGGGNGGGD